MSDKLFFKETDIRIDMASNSVAVRITHIPTGIYSISDWLPTPKMNEMFALGSMNEKLRTKE